MSTDKWATSKSTQLSTKVWVKLLLLLENSILRPSNWKFEPSPKAHTHSDLIINKHRTGQKLHMDLSWHALNSMLQAKTLYHTEKQGFGYPWLSKKCQTHPPKPAEAKPSFRKVSLPSAKLCMLLPTHLWVREFWPQIYSLWQSLDWGLLSNILASMKMGGA